MLAIGSRMFRAYRQAGGQIPETLLKQLNSWRGKVEQEVKTVLSGQSSYEFGGNVEAFFLNAGMKMKLEPKTRVELRQIFEKDITGLIEIINMISATIVANEKRIPLVLIDDMDKPDIDKALAIFHDHRELMMQPDCAIVFTVSSALFYTKEFDAIRDQAIFLPNINLHPPRETDRHIIDGYNTLQKFVNVRMESHLINSQALEDAITYSGGVFREMARIMRSALGRARRRQAKQIENVDIEWATTEIRNEYRRILDKADIAYLRKISEQNRLEYSDRLRPLLQLLAILEYRDKENWCDVHPVLRRLLNE
ncbi:MAG: hypothetical protein HGB26_03585 [Desulfobulbaceae bacterium]|nr:hypothetical protein [Desulfobulbaceae bacterium]